MIDPGAPWARPVRETCRRRRYKMRLDGRVKGVPAMQAILARILCFLGLHDDELLGATFGFGPGGTVQRLRCRRCGRRTTRPT